MFRRNNNDFLRNLVIDGCVTLSDDFASLFDQPIEINIEMCFGYDYHPILSMVSRSNCDHLCPIGQANVTESDVMPHAGNGGKIVCKADMAHTCSNQRHGEYNHAVES